MNCTSLHCPNSADVTARINGRTAPYCLDCVGRARRDGCEVVELGDVDADHPPAPPTTPPIEAPMPTPVPPPTLVLRSDADTDPRCRIDGCEAVNFKARHLCSMHHGQASRAGRLEELGAPLQRECRPYSRIPRPIAKEKPVKADGPIMSPDSIALAKVRRELSALRHEYDIIARERVAALDERDAARAALVDVDHALGLDDPAIVRRGGDRCQAIRYLIADRAALKTDARPVAREVAVDFLLAFLVLSVDPKPGKMEQLRVIETQSFAGPLARRGHLYACLGRADCELLYDSLQSGQWAIPCADLIRELDATAATIADELG